ncbi:MAG: DUF4288 domain-containing protein [Ferruginibacter sp.]
MPNENKVTTKIEYSLTTHYSQLTTQQSIIIKLTLMNWFLAKLVFRIVCGSGTHAAQFEEQVRLIYADDELHAFHKARLLGDGECLREGNLAGVQWKFIDVCELHLLAQSTDGVEIFSTIKEEANAEPYIRNVQKTATQLLQRSLHQFTCLNSMAIGT